MTSVGFISDKLINIVFDMYGQLTITVGVHAITTMHCTVIKAPFLTNWMRFWRTYQNKMNHFLLGT